VSTLKVDTISPKTSWTADEIAGNTIKQSDAGTIGQFVYEYTASSFTNATTEMISTGLSATITPISTTSFIRATFTPAGYNQGLGVDSADYYSNVQAQFRRSIGGAAHTVCSDVTTHNAYWYTHMYYQRYRPFGYSLINIDRPGTTSSITYTVHIGAPNRQWSGQENSVDNHYITLEEILNPITS
jgi:hypothetical protein